MIKIEPKWWVIEAIVVVWSLHNAGILSTMNYRSPPVNYESGYPLIARGHTSLSGWHWRPSFFFFASPLSSRFHFRVRSVTSTYALPRMYLLGVVLRFKVRSFSIINAVMPWNQSERKKNDPWPWRPYENKRGEVAIDSNLTADA